MVEERVGKGRRAYRWGAGSRTGEGEEAEGTASGLSSSALVAHHAGRGCDGRGRNRGGGGGKKVERGRERARGEGRGHLLTKGEGQDQGTRGRGGGRTAGREGRRRRVGHFLPEGGGGGSRGGGK